MQETPPRLRQPVFIVGAGRSGTTLLRSLLTAHSRISITPETHFMKRTLAWGAPDRAGPADFEAFWQQYTANHRFADLGVDESRCLELIELQGERSFRSMYVAILLAYQECVRKDRVGDKTPGNIYFVDRLLDWFPDARFVIMQRDPRAVLASKMSVPWHTQNMSPLSVRTGIIRGSRSLELVEQAMNWSRIYGDIVPRVASDPRVLTLRYESLVAEPEQELRRICEFLEEPFEQSMISQRSTANVPMPAGMARGDLEKWRRTHNAASLGAVSTGSLAKWKDQLSVPELALIEGRCEASMRVAGYAPSLPTSHRLLGRRAAAWLPLLAAAESRSRSFVVRPIRKFRARNISRSPTVERRRSQGVVEIFGPWLLNKGDVLTLNTVDRILPPSYCLGASSRLGLPALPEAPELRKIRARPTSQELRNSVRSGGLRQGLSALRRGGGLAIAPQSMLHAKGYVDERELVALLDASGYAYADQWPIGRLRRRLSYYERLKREGVALVLLPQALGPFENPEVRAYATALLGNFDLIFARDERSLEHVSSLGLEDGKVSDIAVPDITHLIDGSPPDDLAAWSSRVCIVPNARMLDKASKEIAEQYIGFLVRCIRIIYHLGLEPCLVLHEANDASLARTIVDMSQPEVMVFDDDAVATKGYLGACRAVIGSRYHALVGSLSQGTPSIGTSWETHKYDALFADYECHEYLVSPLIDSQKLTRLLQNLIDPREEQRLRLNLQRMADEQTAKVRFMWEHVERMLAARLDVESTSSSCNGRSPA